MTKKENIKIPILKPSQFDDYLFSNWKAPVSTLYEKFHIERIENYKTHLKIPTPPHRRSVYFLIFLTKGNAVRSKGLNKYEITPNKIFCLAADQITSLDFLSEDCEGYYCHFLTEIFNHASLKVEISKDFPNFNLTNDPLIEISEWDRILQLLKILETDYRTDSFELIPFYLFSLLTEIKNQSLQAENPKNDASAFLTQKYKNTLSEFIYKKKTVAEYAEHLAVSPNHLHKSVKAATGKTAHELLDEMRILEAKVLLKQTEMSIAEIAFKIGKEDPSDFSRFLKLLQFLFLQHLPRIF